MEKIEVQKSIYEKLQQDIRVPISKMNLKKSGHNSGIGYNYFELGDFLPQTMELLANAGMCTIFNISKDASGDEIATLTLVDGVDSIVFTIPTADVPRQEGIFNLGSKNTYLKRYLYMNLDELTDQDVAELGHIENEPKVSVNERKATDKQVEMIKGLYDEENIGKIIEYYEVGNLSDLTLKQASEVIARKKK